MALVGDSQVVDWVEPRHRWTGDQLGLRLAFPPAALAEVLRRLVGSPHSTTLTGRAGVGVLEFATSVDVAEAVGRLDAVRAVIAPLGASVVVVSAPAPVKAGLDVWGPVAGLELMRSIKDQFDPGHRLAPGRFVGGI
jgi:glycolate oxidase FAD binding subunit